MTLACMPLPSLGAQEEPGRRPGEVTREMLRRTPPAGSILTPYVLPTPQEVYAGAKDFDLGSKGAYRLEVRLVGEAQRFPLLAPELHKRLTGNFGARQGSAGGPRVVFALSATQLPVGGEQMGKQLATIPNEEAYVLNCVSVQNQDYVLVLGRSEKALWRALATVTQLVVERNGRLVLPAVEIVDYPQMQQRALLADIGGQGFMVGPARWEYAQWQEFVDWMVDHKFNELWLEIIGSGRLMGNLNMDKGEWIGFPLELESYPQLVARDRPISRWDDAKQAVVRDTYTAPNVKREFMPALIDYARARGIKCVVFIGYDYFANQLPVVLGVPANDPTNKDANKVYDALLKEIVGRYRNADGVIFHTIENKIVPPNMLEAVVRRVHEGRAIVKAINPAMDLGVLNDYLEWRPREEFQKYSDGIRDANVYQVYSPHTAPYNKAWKRIHGDVFRYELFTQYAWDHIVYISPERVKREVQDDYINGYRKVVSQAWYFDVFALNFMTMAEMSWNSTGRPLPEFWDAALDRTFGPAAKRLMATAFAHTRFDVRHDIVERMILRDQVDRPFQFWDMYTLTNFDGLKDSMLVVLEEDARASRDAAEAALPLVRSARAKEMVNMTIISAQRRYHLATSARFLLKALAAKEKGDRAGALAAMDQCLTEGDQLVRAAKRLGMEYPLAVHDDEVLQKYRDVREDIARMP